MPMSSIPSAAPFAPAVAVLVAAGALAGCMGAIESGDGEVNVFLKVEGDTSELSSLMVTITRIDAVTGAAGQDTCPNIAGAAMEPTATEATDATPTETSPTETSPTETSEPETTTTSAPATVTYQGPTGTNATTTNETDDTATGNVTDATTSPADTTDGCPTLEAGKLGVCHETGSSRNRFVFIVVNENGWTNGHKKHAGDFLANSADDCADDVVRCPPPAATDTTTSVPANETEGTGNTTGANATFQGPTATNTTGPTADDMDPPGARCSVEPRAADSVTIVEERKTIDLLEFRGQGRIPLGSKAIDPGSFTRLRLFVESAEAVFANGTAVEADLAQGAVLAVESFTVAEDQETSLTLSVDLESSLVLLTDGGVAVRPTVTDVQVGADVEADGGPLGGVPGGDATGGTQSYGPQ